MKDFWGRIMKDFYWRIRNYSEEQRKEFEKLYQEVLRIEENLKTDFYLKKPLAHRSEIIMEDAKCLRKYLEEVPLNVRKRHLKKGKIEISNLTGGLLEVKGKL